MIEILGIVATLFIAVGFMMKNQVYIRAFNLVGCVLFVIYGALIGSVSVFVLNALIGVINARYILSNQR